MIIDVFRWISFLVHVYQPTDAFAPHDSIRLRTNKQTHTQRERDQASGKYQRAMLMQRTSVRTAAKRIVAFGDDRNSCSTTGRTRTNARRKSQPTHHNERTSVRVTDVAPVMAGVSSRAVTSGS